MIESEHLRNLEILCMADMTSVNTDEEYKSAKPLKLKFGKSKYCQRHKLRILDVRNNYLDAVVVFAWTTNKRTSS